MKPFGSTKSLNSVDPSLVSPKSDDHSSSDEPDDDDIQFQYKPPQMTKAKKPRSKANPESILKSGAMQRKSPGPVPDQVPVPQPGILKRSHRKVKRLRPVVLLPPPAPATIQTTRSGRVITKPIRFSY